MSGFDINEDARSCGDNTGQTSSQRSEPTESAFPDEDEDTLTMQDVIEREDKLEEEASAVLGNSDEKNCTYSKGYIPRQALYSCATCNEDSNNPAAICLACSLECHDNHEVYELYTKRNYRCDCGNSKFKTGFECRLADKDAQKQPLNEKNRYNHNFVGRYCVCDKRYPPDENDDSAESEDEMWQCIVCEDWYHTKHLNTREIPSRFDEMICGQCVEKLEFVHYYRDDSQDEIDSAPPSNLPEEVISGPENQTDVKPEPIQTPAVPAGVVVEATASCSSVQHQDAASSTGPVAQSITPEKSQDAGTLSSECDTNDSQIENRDPGLVPRPVTKTESAEPVAEDCFLEGLKKRHPSPLTSKSALFWSDHAWRSKLCRCSNCSEMYRAKECEFLLDEKDTVHYYEAQGRALAKDGPSPMERGMSALNRMNRAAVVEAFNGYNELKNDLSDYLRKFADSKKVVRAQDIHEFFEQLKSKKRPRLDY